jgi:hypothetical protein
MGRIGQPFDIRDRQDIYRVRRFGKMFEELDARNAEMMMKTSEELHPYISVCANI